MEGSEKSEESEELEKLQTVSVKNRGVMAKIIKSLVESIAGNRLQRTLKTLAKNHTAVRLMVENSNLSFYTVISLREEKLLVVKPAYLVDDELTPGKILRFVVPDGSRNLVRLELLDPNFERKRGDNVMLCEMPLEFAPKSRRRSDRYDTGRYKNLLLSVPHFDEEMRVLDISREGCKVYVSELEDWNLLNPGVGMGAGKLKLGTDVEINLDFLTPRNVDPPTVSFEWKVPEKSPSAGYIGHLIKSLGDAEARMLKFGSSTKTPN